MLKRSLILLLICISSLYAETVNLKIPIMIETPNKHQFYHELLITALEEAGHTVIIETEKLPWQRVQVKLKQGDLSLSWMLESEQRNSDFIDINVNLTNKLIGNRILFIRRDSQPIFNGISTLDEFRQLNLVGAFGEGWFDSEVWGKNDLEYQEQSGNWKNIYKMLEKDRIYDYFSRGFVEILKESEAFPELLVENNLVLIYDRDFHYYLSSTGEFAGAKYKDIIESALFRAQETGLITRLINKYWAEDFAKLNYDKRVKIYLETPN